jgi:hypothetical protein
VVLANTPQEGIFFSAKNSGGVMETFKEAWEFVSESIWPHWIGIFYTLVVSVTAQTVKTRVLTSEYARKYRVVFWIRRVFPLTLIGLSALIGCIVQSEVAPGVTSLGHRVLYFSACACFAIIGYDIVKQWAKKRYDVDLDIGGKDVLKLD